jgi:hypothetical protein
MPYGDSSYDKDKSPMHTPPYIDMGPLVKNIRRESLDHTGDDNDEYYGMTDYGHEAAHAVMLAKGTFADKFLAFDASAPGTPGHQLHEFWTKNPKGLAKWADKPHPWTALYHHLRKYIHNDDEAKATAAKWFHDVKGYWPGDQKGKNPVGPG